MTGRGSSINEPKSSFLNNLAILILILMLNLRLRNWWGQYRYGSSKGNSSPAVVGGLVCGKFRDLPP